MGDKGTMLRSGDPRWRDVERELPDPPTAAEALRRGLALSAFAARLKQAGRRASDGPRA
jgi:hypothetical protein